MARVKSAFKKTGLYPVDRHAIDESQLVKSHLKPVDPHPSTSSGSSEGAVAIVTPSSGSTHLRVYLFNLSNYNTSDDVEKRFTRTYLTFLEINVQIISTRMEYCFNQIGQNDES